MPSYFAFMDVLRQEFIFELTDEAKIAQARRIVSGEEKNAVHVMGRIKKTPQPYNPNWSYHLLPETISFFQVAIEACDATMTQLEDHLEEAGGIFLPGCLWCPRTSRVTREVSLAEGVSA